MPYLLSIDPGEESGCVLGAYSDTRPYERIDYWQITGGLSGFLEWVYGPISLFPHPYMTICEKFVPLAGEFSHTLETVEPLRIEGALIALGLMPDCPNPRWQRASCQLIAEDKKTSNQILRDHGLWLTGKDVGRKDANDVISATKHALYYLKNTLRHEPTLDFYFGEQ